MLGAGEPGKAKKSAFVGMCFASEYGPGCTEWYKLLVFFFCSNMVIS